MCPWEGFCQATLSFCEAVLCSWIRQPGNTYSSLAYIIVGILLLRNSHIQGTLSGKHFGFTSIILGLGSFIYHATGTCLGGELDYLGMFLVTGLLTGLNCRRLFGISWRLTYSIVFIITVALHALACLFPHAARVLFALGSPCCLLEIVLWLRKKFPTRYKAYGLSWGIISIAFVFWMLDQSSFCNPEYHWLNGHVVWHLLTAASFIPLTVFYLQFPSLQKK